MAVRRPKKLARNGPARTADSLRVGPGMETLELTFTPTHVGRQTKSNRDTDKSVQEGENALLSWNIRWEVDVGAAIDEGSRLARVFRGGGKHDEQWSEHVIRGELTCVDLVHNCYAAHGPQSTPRRTGWCHACVGLGLFKESPSCRRWLKGSRSEQRRNSACSPPKSSARRSHKSRKIGAGDLN